MDTTNHYSPLEEKTNIISHAIGLALSIVALLLMLVRAGGTGSILAIVSAAIFGISLIALVCGLNHVSQRKGSKSKSPFKGQ